MRRTIYTDCAHQVRGMQLPGPNGEPVEAKVLSFMDESGHQHEFVLPVEQADNIRGQLGGSGIVPVSSMPDVLRGAR